MQLLILQMFISEEDSFKLTTHEVSYKTNGLNENSTFHSNNTSFQRATLNFQNSFTDFTQTISKYLCKGPYLQNLTQFNPFCPICLKFVYSNELFTICNIRNSQIFLIHDKCLLTNPSFSMNLTTEEQDDLLILKDYSFENMMRDENHLKNLFFQSRDFLIEIIFYHPISEKKFGKLQKKLKVEKQNNLLNFKLTQIKSEDDYSPNMIVLPLTDFKIQIGIQLIGSDLRTKFSKFSNFKKISAQTIKKLVFGNKEIQLKVQIYDNQQQKQKVLKSMNYKYPHNSKKTHLIVIYQIQLQMPQIFKDQESKLYDQIVESSSSKVLQFLELDGKLDDIKSHESRKTSQNHLSFESFESKKKSEKQLRRSQLSASQNNDHEKVNLDKLIKTDTLKSFVKHNTQSRSFQSFLEKATNDEIDIVIQHMNGEFVDLMRHQYGNYMMQKLFSVCNLQRKIYILQVLIDKLSEIITNKQGTHAFQDFLSFFTSDQEYILILNKIRENFYELCIHNNSTHFIQKTIKLFPMELMNEFFYYCVQNIYQFSCDKNGMCVLKYMMRKLRELSDRVFDKSTRHQQCIKLVQEYKKLFAQATLFNLDAIIGDMYGNYVVQFNFQLFQPEWTSALTDSILMKLPQYSLSKYSTNVVFKCINSYWMNCKQYVSNTLKQVFQPYLILEMYKNKDGNKILLEVMEKYESYEIWNRLYNVLITTEPSRFYHDRWGACLGYRSGNVGGNWNSFSDAVQKYNTKRKNNKLY